MEYTGREYEELLGLKPPWIVEKVIIDPAKKRVEVYISHMKGRMKCPSCGLECIVYDHLDERVWRDLNSIDFATFLHARPPRISCSERGTVQADMPWSERSSRFTTGFEVMAIDVLISTDVKSASGILGITWNEAWHIMQKAVSRGLARKTTTPARIGIDEKYYGKHHCTVSHNEAHEHGS